jgi:hypothetical protein
VTRIAAIRRLELSTRAPLHVFQNGHHPRQKSTHAASRHGVEIDTTQYVNPSAGALEYLGSWHTHPEGGTGISDTDEQTASRLASLRALGYPLIFLIRGA